MKRRALTGDSNTFGCFESVIAVIKLPNRQKAEKVGPIRL